RRAPNARLADPLLSRIGFGRADMDPRIDSFGFEHHTVAANIWNTEPCQDIARRFGKPRIGCGRDKTTLELLLSVSDKLQFRAETGAQSWHPKFFFDDCAA